MNFLYLSGSGFNKVLLVTAILTLSACGGSGSGSITGYRVAGTVTGLGDGDSVTLTNNGADNQKITGPASTFTFSSQTIGENYKIAVKTTSGLTCTPSANTGSIASANINNVKIVCSSTTVRLSGSVTGLSNSTVLTLTNNGVDIKTIKATGQYSAFIIASGADYHVTANNTGTTQTCIVLNPGGTNTTADKLNININCEPNPIVSGVVYGNDGTLPALNGITVEARWATDDAVFNSTITKVDSSIGDGAFSLQVPKGKDFYLHFDGLHNTTNGTIYINENLEIENETTNRTAMDITLIDPTFATFFQTQFGIDVTKSAIFLVAVADAQYNGVAGVRVNTSPAVSAIEYALNNTAPYRFSTTGPTTVAGVGAFFGYVTNPARNATYTFTLTPGASAGGYTSVKPVFRLRLISGEISEPIFN